MKRSHWRFLGVFLLSTAAFSPLAAQESEAEAAARIRTLYFLRDFEAGVLDGLQLLDRFPEAAELRAWILLNMARDGQAREAAEAAQKMTESAPDSPWGWFALAGALNWADERKEDALSAAAKALQMMPEHPDFLWLQAETLLRQGRNKEAVAFVDVHRGQVDNPAELITVRGNAIYTGSSEQPRLPAALDAFEEARKIDPMNLSAHYLAGTYLERADRPAEAYHLLRNAASLAPDSTAVNSVLWRTIRRLQDRSPEARRSEIEAGINRLLERRGTYPGTLLAIFYEARELKNKEKQETIARRILDGFPDSRQAEWVLISRMREFRRKAGEQGLQDTEQKQTYRRMLEDFLARPLHQEQGLLGETYWNLFFLLKEDPAVPADELLKVAQGMIRHERLNLHSTYQEAAIALAERKVHLDEAERFAREGLVDGRKWVESRRSEFKTQGDFERTMNWMTGRMHDALGWVLFHAGRDEEAEQELLRAYDLNHESLVNLHHLGQLYEARRDVERAEQFYVKGLGVETPGKNPCAEALRSLYQRRHGNLEGVEDYFSGLREADRVRRKEKIMGERAETAEPAPHFRLKSLDGNDIALESLRGRIVVINFWGIWCGWCVKEMPDYQKLHEKYRSDPEVAILTINNDRNPDDVLPWMRERKFDFAVLLDGGYAASVEMFAFPTTWFLDRQGQKVFVKEGWSEKLLEEFSWRIEAIRQQDPKPPGDADATPQVAWRFAP